MLRMGNQGSVKHKTKLRDDPGAEWDQRLPGLESKPTQINCNSCRAYCGFKKPSKSPLNKEKDKPQKIRFISVYKELYLGCTMVSEEGTLVSGMEKRQHCGWSREVWTLVSTQGHYSQK